MTVGFKLRQILEELQAHGTALRVEEFQRLAIPDLDHDFCNLTEIAGSRQMIQFERNLLMDVIRAFQLLKILSLDVSPILVHNPEMDRQSDGHLFNLVHRVLV